MTTPEIEHLCEVIVAIRRSWKPEFTAPILMASAKPYDQLVDDAIDAARNPELKSLNVLKTHNRPKPRIVDKNPPRDLNCPTCNRPITEHSRCTTPSCRPAGGPPSWWQQSKDLDTDYLARIRQARRDGDYALANALQAELKTRRTELWEAS